MPDKNYAGNSGLSAVFGAIKSVLNNKVDKEAGKGLSTNDYTDEEKAALAGKQDELTFDNIPTENSTNPVKSGGVYASDEAIRKWTTAEAKSVSGNPITLTDGSARNAEGLAVTCEPVQDLHGYDHPWAGGAGKNKLPMVLEDIKSANTSGTWSGNAYTLNGVTFTVLTDDGDNVTGIKVTGTASANTNFVIAEKPVFDGQAVMSGCPSNGSDSTYFFQYSNNMTADYKDVGSGISVSQFDYATYPDSNVKIQIRSGYVCPTAGLTFYPMIRLASVSDATFEPYTNECPITGRTECVVDRDSRNIWDEEWEAGNINDSDGQNISSTSTIRSKNYIPVDSSKQYFIGGSGASVVRIHAYDESKTWIEYMGNVSGSPFSLPTNCKYIRFRTTGAYGPTYNNNICINTSDASFNGQYVPYSHDNATIAFGQTVYGGSVDFKTGKVTVTHSIVDLGNYTWGFSSSYQSWYTDGIRDFKKGEEISGFRFAASAICDNYEYVQRAFIESDNGKINLYFQPSTSFYRCWVKDLSTISMSAAEFKTYVTGKYICYELETPTELTLTPAELELLKGYNYITSNGTTIALAYLPDSLLAEAENYVDAKIPPAPSSDGTYVLTCTVTSGTPAYTWESAT